MTKALRSLFYFFYGYNNSVVGVGGGGGGGGGGSGPFPCSLPERKHDAGAFHAAH
jgi:hypothetical protein